jgi:hypothetical protein
MRISRGLAKLSLKRLDLCAQSSSLRLQPYDILRQGRIAGRLGSAARTLTQGLAYVPVSSLGVCRVSERRGGTATSPPAGLTTGRS